MTQDARKLSLAFVLGAAVLGCQSSEPLRPKPAMVPPPQMPAKAAVPVGSATTISPSRLPVVNGAPVASPPVIEMPQTGTVTRGALVNPPAQPVRHDPVLPVAPPTPPDMSGSVTPPVASPILPPSGM